MSTASNSPFIIATIGQYSCAQETLIALVDAGVSVFRLNLAAKLGFDEHHRRLKLARDVIAFKGVVPVVRVMLDIPFPGSKVRIGMLPLPKHAVTRGQKVRFKSGTVTEDFKEFVPVDVENLGLLVTPNQVITVGDGELALTVETIESDCSFIATALNDYWIPCVKSLNMGVIRNSMLDDSFITTARFLGEEAPDLIALSFVESGDQFLTCKNKLSELGAIKESTRLVPKIETLEGVKNAEEILSLSDMFIVGRGDLALNANFSMLPVLQKRLISLARKLGKIAIVSTQIIESAGRFAVPYRAEIMDVANIVLDGAQGIMLAKETSATPNAPLVVKTVNEIIASIRERQSLESL